jgi:hypothetical protein
MVKVLAGFFRPFKTEPFSNLSTKKWFHIPKKKDMESKDEVFGPLKIYY